VTEKAKQTLKTVMDLLEKARESTRKAIEDAAPGVQKSIDASVEAAGKAFTGTMQTIDGATGEDQLKILKAYRKFLGGQAGYVDDRIKDLEEKTPKQQ